MCPWRHPTKSQTHSNAKALLGCTWTPMMLPSMDSNTQQIEAGGRSAVVDTVPYLHLTSPKYYMQ